MCASANAECLPFARQAEFAKSMIRGVQVAVYRQHLSALPLKLSSEY